MLQQLNVHCEENQLLPDYQSAYQKNYSCETTLVKISNDILWAMENQEVTVLVAIDLNAAFDTVDHDVLHDNFGVAEKALGWCNSYFWPRTFTVNVGQHYSSPRPLDFSVPQGSLCGTCVLLHLRQHHAGNRARTCRYPWLRR